ncbi:hypothetical protein E2R62_06915 [Citrobacter rodentium]|uniref:Uncharacterized protein n=1 Tax=Citrobacter rodentium TaxID=67825 RepID=A0A482PE04_CITRO|nr:hypothetical protein E2R62_06915 [Citrobacter rodentium]HAT8011931.1 hypothetical protein [Citrobacter rodentium NBRC 105723 = DSM 16636]HAT8016867.1 hypothetical protein [Citrobacter rodentium]HAT8026576.1 hypothetical protein [Citrobacter rodentium]HAT8031657.1 hypothetical protein [Citrobacter rodentium]
MMKNILDRNLIKEFHEISKCADNLESYERYYQAYVRFIIKNNKFFTKSILEKWGLDVLISINIEDYLVPNPGLSLTMEQKRLSKSTYEDIDTFAMSIRDTLWDMVTVYSGKDCPITPNDELRYIKIVSKDKPEKILLECAGCGWTEDINGDESTEIYGKIFPANKNEIDEYIKKK